MDVTFALIREGTSDDGLIPHLQTLLVRHGAASAVGASRPYKGDIRRRIEQLLAEDTLVDIVFVHADADARDSSVRRAQIEEAAREGLPEGGLCIPVVPVQELEAWLLVDEVEIRRVTGRPSGTQPLGIPAVRAIETTSSPKEVLQRALLQVSDTTGRRRDKERSMFPQRRRTLLERLDLNGAVKELSSFQQLLGDVQRAVAALL